MSEQRMFDALARIYPRSRLLREPGQLVPYESDALTAFVAHPRAVVIPITQEEVVQTVRLCHEHDTPFVARGSGTSLSGGSLPIAEGIVIALNRLNKIIKLDGAQRLAVVEPGVINLAVSEAAQAHGLYYAPDPSSQQICTIGGNVAFNSGGAHCLKYGMTANHVLGMKAILADGEIVQIRGDSLDHVGPDLAGLFVGSEGLFGIALEITLRLLPCAESLHTVLAGYASLTQAGEAVSNIIASGLLPGAMEIMDRLAIDAVESAVHCEYPKDAAAVMIVELEGPREQVAIQSKQLENLIIESGASDVRVAENDQQRALIWKGRKSAFSAVGRLSPDYLVQDGVVPRRHLSYALQEVSRLSEAHGLRVANVFHAGDGNLHPLILYDGRQAGEFKKAETLADAILSMCVKLGGSITGEHGVGIEKRHHLPSMFSTHDIDTMKRIRSAMDPKHVANRRKMFLEPDELAFKNEETACP